MFDFFLDEKTKSYNRGFAAGENARNRIEIQESYQDGYKAGLGQSSILDDDMDDEDLD